MAAPPPVSGVEPAQAGGLRLAAVLRMSQMLAKLRLHAWDRRYRDPIAPYGLALCYASDTPSATAGPVDLPWRLWAATKLWLRGPETESLPLLLFELLGSLGHRLAEPGFEVCRDFTNRVDPGRPADAGFVGVGVCSLDTRAGAWAQLVTSVDGPSDLPGVIRIVLVDGSVVVCDQGGRRELNAFAVRTTRPISFGWAATTSAQLVEAEQLHREPEHQQVLPLMQQLVQLLGRHHGEPGAYGVRPARATAPGKGRTHR